ncbi:hypothetical protein SAMN00790413_04483 [Deinococcus hopiensis KR-140]|uniref:Uncharacterized protein n=2 Tax=Deinococcus TaxID=1298 RepID=A0A1W1UJD2_9DEIO|nr:hypothetical protein SAMN00790413_04483 [Deinococcus hopiensis KR-140]
MAWPSMRISRQRAPGNQKSKDAPFLASWRWISYRIPVPSPEALRVLAERLAGRAVRSGPDGRLQLVPYALRMAVLGKVLLSLLVTFAALLAVYMSAYAFSVPSSLLQAGQVALLLVAALVIGLVWRLPPQWLLPLLLIVGGLALLLLKQGGGF